MGFKVCIQKEKTVCFGKGRGDPYSCVAVGFERLLKATKIAKPSITTISGSITIGVNSGVTGVGVEFDGGFVGLLVGLDGGLVGGLVGVLVDCVGVGLLSAITIEWLLW